MYLASKTVPSWLNLLSMAILFTVKKVTPSSASIHALILNNLICEKLPRKCDPIQTDKLLKINKILIKLVFPV